MKQAAGNLSFSAFLGRKAIFLVLVSFVLSVFHSSFAQNLVLNPGFEEITICPDNGSQISRAFPWKSPLNNDADLLNACASNPTIAIPQHFGASLFYPRTGNGCAALFGSNGPGLNYREYIQDSLSETLTSDVAYAVSFYCFFPPFCKYGLNQLGCHFSGSPFSHSETNASVINVPTHILNFDKKYLIDTLNWTRVSGIYKASGGEKYISIGNFHDDAHSNLLPLASGWYDGAYYFIDDISVEAITSPFWQYRDTTIQYGDSVLIGPAITGLDIDWYTSSMDFIKNAPGVYVKPPTSRNYIAKETFNGIETTHDVYVTVTGGVGIEETQSAGVAIFPNPSDGIFNVTIGPGNETDWKIQVFDLTGRKINVPTEKNQVDLSDQESGIYNLTLLNQVNGAIIFKKIVKNN